MYLTRRLLLAAAKSRTSSAKNVPPPSFRDKANEWIASKWGRRFRIGLLGGTIIAYPIGSLIFNGPLLKYVFHKRHSVDENLPEGLQNLINTEYARWKERENRLDKDAVAYFSLQNKEDELDTVARGSLGVRMGARIALPFYARFETEDDVREYCRKNLEPLNFRGEPACVIWDSEAGRELIDSFLLSDKAKRFLIMRDLYSHDGWNAYASRAISWATWTTFSSIFTYWLHWSSRLCKGTALSFAVIYSLFVAVAWYASSEWYRLYRYMTDIYADSVSAHLSFDHCAGGKEYYWKMLKRNRILRDFTDNGFYQVKATGDVHGITTSILTRYDLLKDVSAEDDELLPVVEGDDF
uniref:Transmembrane protein n=1 Tax=Steinernema glaseri TaxID=37863 RepID=A0A1I7YBL4_9BILA